MTQAAPRQSNSAFRLVTTIATTIGLCIMGDSLLYSILPLAAEGLGIPLYLVGLLLSANRLIRLASNTWISAIFERFGPHSPFIGVVLLGFFSTILYLYSAQGAWPWSFALFLSARILWGISWSGLRQGGIQAVWTGAESHKGRLMGLLWGIVRLGSAISVIIGGWLYDHFGYTTSIGTITLITALALPVVLTVRWPKSGDVEKGAAKEPTTKIEDKSNDLWEGWRLSLEKPVQRWLILSSFFEYLLFSVILSTTSLFLAERLGGGDAALSFGIGIATATGLLHAARWLSDLGSGPILGALSDYLGQARMAVILIATALISLIGAVTLPPTLAIICLLIAFLCDGGLNTTLYAAASGTAQKTARPHLFIGVFTTASDAGSAIGPLLAFSIGNIFDLPTLYILIAGLSTLNLTRYWWLAECEDREQKVINNR